MYSLYCRDACNQDQVLNRGRHHSICGDKIRSIPLSINLQHCLVMVPILITNAGDLFSSIEVGRQNLVEIDGPIPCCHDFPRQAIQKAQ